MRLVHVSSPTNSSRFPKHGRDSVAILPSKIRLQLFNFSIMWDWECHYPFHFCRCLLLRCQLASASAIGCPVAGEEDAATAHRRRKGRQVPKVHRDLHGSRWGKAHGSVEETPWKRGRWPEFAMKIGDSTWFNQECSGKTMFFREKSMLNRNQWCKIGFDRY